MMKHVCYLALHLEQLPDERWPKLLKRDLWGHSIVILSNFFRKTCLSTDCDRIEGLGKILVSSGWISRTGTP